MDELIKLLDENLQYVSHEMNDGVIGITVASTRASATCPYCVKNLKGVIQNIVGVSKIFLCKERTLKSS